MSDKEPAGPPALAEVDPFDLPEWLGTGEVVWRAESSVGDGSEVRGCLTGAGQTLPCDLLGADLAFPRPVLGEQRRAQAHQAWTLGQVLLVSRADRLVLAVPGTTFDADRCLDALGRLVKAVGARPERWLVELRL